MPRHYVLDENRETFETDVYTWGWFLSEGFDQRRLVGSDYVGKYHISTVFVGIQNCLFETLVDTEDEDFEVFLYKYDTWGQAHVGHNLIVGHVMASEGIDKKGLNIMLEGIRG